MGNSDRDNLQNNSPNSASNNEIQGQDIDQATENKSFIDYLISTFLGENRSGGQ